MLKDVAVLIPAYRNNIPPYESYSLDRCNQIFNQYDRILCAPDGLSVDEYLKDYDGLKVMRFPSDCFESHRAYDRMMLQPAFYERFTSYRYILIYQLDAFVFRDELGYWCDAGYDYVGAPWIGNAAISDIASSCTRIRRIFHGIIPAYQKMVGNGGFCLRNVGSMINNLRWFRSKAQSWPYYEDTFFSFFVTSYNPLFRIPDTQKALQFAFEMHPAHCLKMNEGRLPFGCHGWEKYGTEFWKPYVEECGYRL